jgi:hypothetical protein
VGFRERAQEVMVNDSVSVPAIALVFGLSVASAGAQTPKSPDAGPPPSQLQARYQISVMEAVFEAAVQHGAQILRTQMQAAMPDMVVLTGGPRARGFRLEGYGVFFDVEVPAVRQTIAWSFKTLNQPDANVNATIAELRTGLQGVTDRHMRDGLDQMLRRLEAQVGGPVPAIGPNGPAMPAPGVVGANTVESVRNAAAPTASRPAQVLDDPVEAYTAEVIGALIDAMLDHSGSLQIGPDEWLTIAARDNLDRRLSPSDPYEMSTIVLRLKGSDLATFLAGRLTRDEARRCVEVREF